jgi:hypothetical protein
MLIGTHRLSLSALPISHHLTILEEQENLGVLDIRVLGTQKSSPGDKGGQMTLRNMSLSELGAAFPNSTEMFSPIANSDSHSRRTRTFGRNRPIA